ncbi:MAG: regulatory protein RecX [Lachnospiraceae bacterium]|nr:regulatory protein RecX [Lachnospiraceae bacterium]
MIVTDIVEHTKSRCKVYINQEFAFVLYKGELRLYGVEKERELSRENYLKLIKEVLPKRAKLRAMNLLKSREYTRRQLGDKLRQGLYPEEVIEEALDYVASYKYIDDERYALSYIRYHSEQKSRKSLELSLLKKGIDKNIIRRAWILWEEEGNRQDEEAQIRRLLEKRKFDGCTADAKEIQKTYAFLMRKGFSGETIRKFVKNDRNDDFYLT